MKAKTKEYCDRWNRPLVNPGFTLALAYGAGKTKYLKDNNMELTIVATASLLGNNVDFTDKQKAWKLKRKVQK